MSRPAEQLRARQPATQEEANEATIEAGDTIANEPVVVKIKSGRDVSINRVKVMQISRVLRLVSDFFNELKVEKMGDLPSLDLKNPALILNLIAKYTDQVFEVVVMLTDLTEEEVKEMEMDDAILIAREVWLLNQNFFLAKILPLVKVLLPVMDPEDEDSLSPESESTETSSTTSSSSSGKGSRKRKR